ncbi:MAG: peptidoglycan editing factor PgeF [Alphaproteobacteria bacterium]|nr:peptidoglycan editing factor PgeF [Alphaproteobacteria bacterium]
MISSDDYIQHASLINPSIKHGFFTRRGGVSQGIYQGLNCGSGSSDNKDHIEENRKKVAQALGKEANHLLSLYQIHSNEVYILDDAPNLAIWNSMDRPKADAIVTRRSDVALGILTADCGPLLFSDPNNKIIGAAHAGWKGALTGIIENTIDAMISLGAEKSNIHVVLGPCIHQPSYEVSGEFRSTFVDQDKNADTFFDPGKRAGHFQFDLPAFILRKLESMNVGSFGNVNKDTYPDSENFYSYRRTTHNKEADYGRQVSAIAIDDKD